MNSWTIYTLRLQDGKYYVGRTERDWRERLDEHQLGKGAAWTRLYPVIKLHAMQESNNPHDEKNITLDMMAKYGIDNVRGGPYTQIELHAVTRQEIEREINSAQNRCYKCGRSGHFAKNCRSTSTSTPSVSSNLPTGSFGNPPKVSSNVNPRSRPFSSPSTAIPSAFSVFEELSAFVNSTKKSQKKTRIFHEIEDDSEDDSEEEEGCFICGRDSHFAADCYATYDIDGNRITKRTSKAYEKPLKRKKARR